MSKTTDVVDKGLHPPWSTGTFSSTINLCLNLPVIQPLMHVQIGLQTTSLSHAHTTQTRHHILHQWLCTKCAHTCLHKSSFRVKNRKIDEIRVLVTPSPPVEPFLCECGCDIHQETSNYVTSITSNTPSLTPTILDAASPSPSSRDLSERVLYFAKQRATRWRLGYVDLDADDVHIRSEAHTRWESGDICGIASISHPNIPDEEESKTSSASTDPAEHSETLTKADPVALLDSDRAYAAVAALKDCVASVWGHISTENCEEDETIGEFISVSVRDEDVQGDKEEDIITSSSRLEDANTSVEDSDNAKGQDNETRALIASVMRCASDIRKVRVPPRLRATLQSMNGYRAVNGSGNFQEFGILTGFWENSLVEGTGKYVGKIFVEFRNCIPPGTWDSAWKLWRLNPEILAKRGNQPQASTEGSNPSTVTFVDVSPSTTWTKPSNPSSLSASTSPFTLKSCSEALAAIRGAAEEHYAAYRAQTLASGLKMVPVKRVLRETLRNALREMTTAADNGSPSTNTSDTSNTSHTSNTSNSASTSNTTNIGDQAQKQPDLNAYRTEEPPPPSLADIAVRCRLLFSQSTHLRFVRALLRWCKHRFTWVNAPSCCMCGQETSYAGSTAPLPSESQFGARYVELYHCAHRHETRFPRYNDLVRCLSAARGRCGEYNQAWGLVVRVAGVWLWHVAELWLKRQVAAYFSATQQRDTTTSPESSIDSSESKPRRVFTALMASLPIVSARAVNDATDHVWTEIAVASGSSADDEVLRIIDGVSENNVANIGNSADGAKDEETVSSKSSEQIMAELDALEEDNSISCSPPSIVTYIHSDPCEDAINEPLLYSKGWGKQLREVWSVGLGGAELSTDRYSHDVHAARLRQKLPPWAAAALQCMLRDPARAMDGVATVNSHPMTRVSSALSVFGSAFPVAVQLLTLTTVPITPSCANMPSLDEKGPIPNENAMKAVLIAGVVAEILVSAREAPLWTHVTENMFATASAGTSENEMKQEYYHGFDCPCSVGSDLSSNDNMRAESNADNFNLCRIIKKANVLFDVSNVRVENADGTMSHGGVLPESTGLRGRTTGSFLWRQQRGENGSS